ncbi:MAG: hypothetical protein RR945_02495 [Erysipelotrichaceae bacterium]
MKTEKKINYKYEKLNGEKGLDSITVEIDKNENLDALISILKDFLILEHELLDVEILDVGSWLS